jgi:hypothetical protein
MDNWQEQFEKEFSRLAEKRLMAMPNYEPYMVGSTVKTLLLNDTLIVVQSLLGQQKQELLEKISLPEYDHSKCPIHSSCIGYQNAESDLENIKKSL